MKELHVKGVWIPHNGGTDLPIDPLHVTKFESVEVLIVSGGEVEACEFSCGPHPEPWYAFGHYHAGFVTHWMPFPAAPGGKLWTTKNCI